MLYLSKIITQLFVAVRTRLTLSNHQINVSFIIGIIMIFLGIGNIILPWLLSKEFIYEYNGFDCTPLGSNIIYAFYVLVQDIGTNIYLLIIFVLPLRKLIQFERELTESAKNMGDSEITDNQLSLENIVRKVLTYNTIMILSSIITYILVIIFKGFNVDQDIINFMSGITLFIDSYCIVIQYEDIDVKDIQSEFLRTIVIIIQCNHCCVKPCCCQSPNKCNQGDGIMQSRKSDVVPSRSSAVELTINNC